MKYNLNIMFYQSKYKNKKNIYIGLNNQILFVIYYFTII